MSERLTGAIEEIEAQIAAKEAEFTPLKIAVNQLCQIKGEPARYKVDGMGATGQPKRTLTWKADQFYGRPLAQCVTEYFETREAAGFDRAATVDEIYEATVKGGYKFEGSSGNEDNTKRAIKISLTKNTAQFAKIADNLFGLKKWYPNAKSPRRSNGGDDTDTGDADGETEAEPQETTQKNQIAT